MPVCIVGMHRSGTSLVAGALRACGLYLGKDADLMPAGEDNPAGFWENTRFVDLNDEILSALGGAWDCPPGNVTGWDGVAGVEQLRPRAESLVNEFERVEHWGWKDPRNSLTIPFWRALLEPLQFVVCLRGPMDAAVSLARRNKVSVRLGMTLWTAYMERILATAPPDRRVVTHASRFFSEPRPELDRVLDFLAMAPSEAEIDQALASISPGLWTGPVGEVEVEQAGAPAHVLRLYRELCAEAEAAAPASAPPRERQLARRAAAVVSGNGASNGSSMHANGVGAAETVEGGLSRHDRSTGGISAVEPTTPRRERRELQRVNVEMAIKQGALEREVQMLRALPAEKAELERRLGALEVDYAQAKSSAEELRAEAQRLRPVERRLRDLLAAQSRLEGEVGQLRRSAAEEKDLKERLRGAQEQVSSLERDLAQSREQSTSHRRQTRERIAALRVELAQARQQNRAIVADARDAQSQLSHARKQLARVPRRDKKLQDELGRSSGELARAREELTSTRDELARAQKELLESHEQLLLRDRAQLDSLAPAPTGARRKTSVDPSDYLRMIERLREHVRLVVPPHAQVLVVSRGDEQLLELDSRQAWHFPRDPSGKYAGHHPADGVDATRQLEALRAAGAEFLVIPSTSLWWLDYYTEFAEHLATRCAERFRDPDIGVIVDLTTALKEPAADVTTVPTVGGEATTRLLAQRSTQVHSLLDRCSRLTGQLEEARQRAAADSRDALLRARLKSFLASGRKLVFPDQQTPEVSVVIPSYNQAHLLYQALESLKATSGDTPFEVVIVDNASGEESRELFSRLGNVRVHLNERNTGFGAACGFGAEIARAPYVCFLNSDTIVTPGWLDALVQTARAYPGCGAVGAKLVHADGRLQEAGSMIWNDGSAWAYGRGDDPSAPQYCYPREVDYCSAACLLVSRPLFMRLGGFDERYAPAYYEDSDLCMAIAEAGFKTVYEPRAVVFHLEFGSSDGQDAIALQLRNRELFVEKWEAQLRERLAPAQENVLAARDGRRSKRVLVVDDRIPACGQGSGFPRAAALLESLAALGYTVTLMPARDRRPIEPALSHLQGLGVEVLHSVHDVAATLIERAPMYDVAIVSRPHNLPLANVIRQASERTALIYDAEAVAAARDVLEAEVEGRYVPAAEREAMITAELDTIGCADVVLTVSGPEQRMVQEHGVDRVEVWGDCLPVEKPRRRYRERHDLLFVGSLATPPNADAVSHLLNRILPAVRRRLSARLLIVGADPAPRLWAAPIEATNGVLFTGFVEDLAPVYESARVFLAPHRFAAGVPHKVIEAMAHGVPCVVSRLLGDQLELEDGQGVLVADSSEDFAEKVNRLYGDRRFWADQQRRAMQVVSERYDPGKMREMLRGSVETAVDAVAARSVATGTGDGH